MTDHTLSPHTPHCCQHYPNRVLHKKDLAVELGVCERTISNLMASDQLPQPRWFNSIPVWMLFDIHAFIADTAASSSASGASSRTARKRSKPKAGKYDV